MIKAKEADRAHWKEMWERKQRGKDISQIGMRPREVEILFGPTAVGKTTEVFMTVLDVMMNHCLKRQAIPNGGVVMTVNVMFSLMNSRATLLVALKK